LGTPELKLRFNTQAAAWLTPSIDTC
jgi:hypothetical protein